MIMVRFSNRFDLEKQILEIFCRYKPLQEERENQFQENYKELSHLIVPKLKSAKDADELQEFIYNFVYNQAVFANKMKKRILKRPNKKFLLEHQETLPENINSFIGDEKIYEKIAKEIFKLKSAYFFP